MKRLVYLLPVAGFVLLAVFLFRSLWAPAPGILPSALLDRPAPAVTLAALDAQTQGWGPAELGHGKVVVVNVFSSTCAPCRMEAPVLNRLAQTPGVAFYGFVWKDKPDAARAFLDELGNPFSRIGYDGDGKAGMEWGVYGWPETYVVDAKGVIRFKYVGELTDRIVEEQIKPLLATLR